ncbi:MaoC family dehydratase [Alteriqipengyuania sp.]|uniref:MaoC family dehydratase n=1 Tax=Alteriqipengyuania sp. TaxID=2800692 RepID=UPI0035116E08
MKYYEDLEVGTKASFGNYKVTREEVIEFASKYDPQPFHLDDEAAAKTYFGRLSASGWHTCAMTMRMMVEHFTGEKSASLGSPGIDELSWVKPVYPGDTLRVEAELIEKRQSKSKPHMGFTRTRQTTFNQHGEPVLKMIAKGIIQVRDPSQVEAG